MALSSRGFKPDVSPRPGDASSAAVAAQQTGQLADVVPVVDAIERGLDGGGTLVAQDHAGELAELAAHLGFGERSVEIATMTLDRTRRAAAIGERHSDPRRAPLWRQRAHRRVFDDVNLVAQRGNLGI